MLCLFLCSPITLNLYTDCIYIPHGGSHRLVVNSMLAKYKRVHLAAALEGTAFITYACDRHQDQAISRHGTCLNLKADGKYHYLSPVEVAAALNQCGVGGIFSAEEGTCYASTEYLLCGLPVVSTTS